MPEICRFFGIIIFLYAKVIAKVNEWVDLHEAEILSLWEKAQKGEKIEKIEPLK